MISDDLEGPAGLRLGPDLPSHIAFAVGLPVGTFVAILLPLAFSPALAGLAFVIWVGSTVYLWRLNFRTDIQIDYGSMHVVTPLRRFDANAAAIGGWHPSQGHLFIDGPNGQFFRNPTYTLTLPLRAFASKSRSVRQRHELESAIDAMLATKAPAVGGPQAEHWSIRWTLPAIRLVIGVLAVGLLLEIAVLAVT